MLTMRPEEIERASMKIIEQELGRHAIPESFLPIVLRVIHASADFEFAENLACAEDAVKSGQLALAQGTVVVTDTNMAASGINKKKAAACGSSVRCYMADEAVAAEASRRGVTRAVVSIEHAVAETPNALFAIGNAPTALLRLCELVHEGKARPSLVIGVPVGFVNVVESKEALMNCAVPWITAQGRKGGSTVAAAIVNALLYSMK